MSYDLHLHYEMHLYPGYAAGDVGTCDYGECPDCDPYGVALVEYFEENEDCLIEATVGDGALPYGVDPATIGDAPGCPRRAPVNALPGVIDTAEGTRIPEDGCGGDPSPPAPAATHETHDIPGIGRGSYASAGLRCQDESRR